MTLKKRLPPKEYHDLIQKVFERDKWQCIVCRYRSNLHAHHIVFRSQGGEDALDNLTTLCCYCHEDVHSGLIKICEVYYGIEKRLSYIPRPGWTPKMKVR